MRRKQNNSDGKVVLRSVPSPEVEHLVVKLLSQLMPNTAPETIRAGIARPPVILAKRIRAEKGQKLVEALNRMGAKAAFVPLRPGEERKLADGDLQRRVVEKPVEITPPPGRILRKWLRRAVLVLLLAVAVVYAAVENFPRFYPKGLSPVLQPDRTDISGFLPLDHAPPPLESVHPMDMMEVMKLGYRLSPDRRVPEALGSLTVLFEGMLGDGASPGQFKAGLGRSDGKTLTIPLMMNDQVTAEIQMALPIDFPMLMATSASWISMMASAVEAEPPPQMDASTIPGLTSAITEIQGIDPRSILKGLGTLETLHRTHGPQGVILRGAAQGYGYLLMSLFPDRTDGRDRLAAHGLALLSLARWLAPEMDLTHEEALIAYQMGYTAHALQLIQGKAFYAAGPSARLMMAFIRRDARQLTSPGSRGTELLRRYLSARLFRELEQPRTAERSSAALADKYPNTFPALVEAIYSSPREDANAASRRYMKAVLAALEDMGSGSVPEIPAAGSSEKPAPPTGTPEELLNRADWPEVFSNGTIIDTSLGRQVYQVLYTGAIFLRFQLLLELRDFGEATRVADRLPADTPLAMTLRAQVLAKTGKHKEAAALATKILRNDGTSARLALQAVQLSGEGPERVVRVGQAARRMDDRPDNRFFMASLLQQIWYGDLARSLYSSGLRGHPLRFSAYRELSSVSGAALPLETALETFEYIPALHLSTGDYYARQADPEEAEKSLVHYQRADALAPLEATPVLRARRVLYRLGRKSEAVAMLKAKLDQGQALGTAELRLRFALANTYLDLKQPENAVAAIDPLKSGGGPVFELVMARVLEFKGVYSKAFAAFQDIVRKFPDNVRILAAVAGFNWRVGRFRVAADLVASGSEGGMSGCQWYLEEFADAFQNAPEKRLLLAVSALHSSGTPLSEIRCLAFALEERKAFAAAFTLMNYLRTQSKAEDLDLAVRMAVLLGAWKGENASEAFLKDFLTIPLPPEQAAILYRYGFFKTILEQMDDISVYPKVHRERVRFIYLTAWLNSGRTPAGLDQNIIRHYRGSWLQRKKAQVTGHISPDPDHLAGRFLLGMISQTEFFERIDHRDQRCQYPYVVGLSWRTKGRFPQTATWYQLSRESLQKTRVEFHWAANEMYWWAHLGTGNRNRALDRDISDYFKSLSEISGITW